MIQYVQRLRRELKRRVFGEVDSLENREIKVADSRHGQRVATSVGPRVLPGRDVVSVCVSRWIRHVGNNVSGRVGQRHRAVTYALYASRVNEHAVPG